jgi:hypothetical protein
MAGEYFPSHALRVQMRVVPPQHIPLVKRLKKAESAVGSLWNYDPFGVKELQHVSHAPSPLNQRITPRDAVAKLLVGHAFAICFVGSDADIDRAGLTIHDVRLERLNLDHSRTPSHSPVRNRLLFVNQTRQALGRQTQQRGFEQLFKVIPVSVHRGQFVFSWGTDVLVISRLNLSKRQRESGTVFAARQCNDMVHPTSLPSSVSVVSCALVSGGSLKPRPLSCSAIRESLVAFSFGYQLLVGQTTPRNRIHEGVQPEQSVTFDVAEIQPECKLVNVAFSMLRADVVKDAIDATFENRPNALNSIGIDRAVREMSRAMVDSGVAVEKAIQALIARVFVAVDRGTNFDVVEKALLNRAEVGTVQNKRLCVTATLSHSENWSFANRATAHVQLFVGVLVSFFPTDKSLIDFNDARQFVEVFTARLAESMQHEPRAFLRDADLFGELHRTDSFAGRDDEIHRVDPFVQRNVAALEDCSSANRKRELVASVAAVVTVRSGSHSFTAFALRADNAIRPQARLQVEPCGFLIREPLEQLKRADCRFAHAEILLNSVGAVKYINP